MTHPASHAAALLSSRIIEARKARGKTQQELAQEAGIPQSQVSKIERGQTAEPSFTTVVALARSLDLSLDALASSSEDYWLAELSREVNVSDEEKAKRNQEELLSAWRTVRSKMVKALNDYMSTQKTDELYVLLEKTVADKLVDELSMFAKRGLAPSGLEESSEVELSELEDTIVFTEAPSNLSKLLFAPDLNLVATLAKGTYQVTDLASG